MARVGIDVFSVEKVAVCGRELRVASKQAFTLIFIQEGKGILTVADYQYPFSAGKLFLVDARFEYCFDADLAVAVIIRCPLSFIDQVRLEADRIETCDNLNKLNYIAYNYHSQAGCVFRSQNDLTFAAILIENIVREYNEQPFKDYLIIRQSIAILFNLVARNLINSDTAALEEHRGEHLVMKIITYIQQHIKEPELTRIAKMAQYFKVSKNYFGEYFKKNIGVSYQDYLLDYRLKLVETRLQFSTMRLKEIASELRFNDESHLSKSFKKHRGMTPTAFRISTR